jgi:tripartite-type tricarboxylate transporter receptor subunit TctC
MKKILLVLSFLAASVAHAQSGKVSKIYVGFPPGQATDLVARLLAERLGPALGETVIVENKPGQGGSLILGPRCRRTAPSSCSRRSPRWWRTRTSTRTSATTR